MRRLATAALMRPDAARTRYLARWVIIVLVVIVTSCLESLAEIPLWPHDGLLATSNLLASAVFIATGLLLQGETGQRGTSWALILAGLFHPLGWLYKWNAGPLSLYSQVFGYVDDTCGAWALLRYPGPRLGRYQRTYLVIIFGWMTGGSAIVALLSRPQWNNYSPSSWWPVLYANYSVFQAVSHVFYAGGIVLAACFPLIIWQRVMAAQGLDRAEIIPVAWIGTLGAIVGTGVTAAEYVDAADDNLFAIEGFAILILPLAFLIVVVRRDIRHGAVAKLVIRLPEAGAISEVRQAVQDVLRQVLFDPALSVLYRLPDKTSYLDASGQPAGPPGAHSARRAVAVHTDDSEAPFVIILTNPSITGQRHRELLDAAVKACVLALENARLRADNDLRLKENRELFTRIAKAEQSVRIKLQHDLHDRVQAMLHAIRLELDGAIDTATDQASRQQMRKTSTGILEAISELSEVARDIHPHVLERFGLRAAINDFAERHSTLRTRIDVPKLRFGREVELNAYFIVCEALTNAARHASASSATVRVYTEISPGSACLPEGKILCIEVADDGKGGARKRSRGGLAGLDDRVTALAGSLTITSPPDEGTRLTARIPCE